MNISAKHLKKILPLIELSNVFYKKWEQLG